MVNVSIDVTDLGGEARPGDKVVLWKPAAAGSATHAGRVISTAPVDVFLTNGKATVPDVEPGDMRVLLQCRGVESQGPIPVTVPDSTGTVTLRSLIESQFEYSPPIVSAVQQAADNAAASERAAVQAQVRSEAAADRAETRVDEAINDGANLIRAEVKQDADRAVAAKNGAQAAQAAAELARDAAGVSEANAAQSEADAAGFAELAEQYKNAAGVHAGAAAQDAARAETAEANAAASEQAAAISASNAASSETSAAASAQTATQQADRATGEADRATSEADRSKTEADRAASEAESSAVKAVAEKVDELLAGAPEAYDTLLEIAEELERSQSAEAALVKEIAGKAPLEHKHAIGDVTGLQTELDSRPTNVTVNTVLNGKADKGHTHTVGDVTGLQSALDGKANKDYVDERTPKVAAVTKLPDVQDPDTVYLVLEG